MIYLCNNANATNNPDKALSESSFIPLWNIIKALRTHDERLGDATLLIHAPTQNSPPEKCTLTAISRR
jgi:hypothetical protein